MLPRPPLCTPPDTLFPCPTLCPAATTPNSSTREGRFATNWIELNGVEAGDGFPVVLAHGVPELSYSLRHQGPALADSGYKVICPDQRGYGKSDRPEAIAD